MADYKELLRRAVQALPENNGQARRAVYEKARAALVGQLRAITPPLAARDITTHRLQLEDCIRQVEQEASEAVIAGMQEPTPPPPKLQTTQAPKLETRAPGKPQPAPSEPPPSPGTIEDIIAASEITAPAPPPAKPAPAPKVTAKPEGKPTNRPELRPAARLEAKQQPRIEARPNGEAERPRAEARLIAPPNGNGARPLPAIVARAEAARGKPVNGAPGNFSAMPDGAGRRATLEPRQGRARLEASSRGHAAARQQLAPTSFEEPEVAAAMSSVREVDIEAEPEIRAHVDPQGAIDRAIATLDREARGETHPANGAAIETAEGDDRPDGKQQPAPPPVPVVEKRTGGSFREQTNRTDKEPPTQEWNGRKTRKAQGRREGRGRRNATVAPAFQRLPAETERGGANALTIFFAVFLVLLVGAGGAGFWAWREGYVNLESLFARSPTPVEQQAQAGAAATAVTMAPQAASAATPPGPGAAGAAATALAEPSSDVRLSPAEPMTPVEPATEALALAPMNDSGKTEERLPGDSAAGEPSANAGTAVASVDPSSLAGSQSLLLEASDNGTTGAVPFSGTVEWSKGTDETGAPTLMGKASIPARNLSVDLLLRKNSDPSLPASHLMEINFTVSDTFIGGSVAGLPGVLLKNEELVQGAPLVGASARVIGNSFLFALSASAEDSAANSELLTSRKWMDLAVIYATGKRAIITLEKDDAADAMFREVFAAWGQTASTGQ